MLIINNSFHVVKDTYGISEGKTIISEEVIRCFKGQNTTNYERKGGYIEMTIPIMDSVSSAAASADTARTADTAVQGVLLASVSTESIRTTMEIMNRNALIIEIVMVIFIFGIAVGISYILIRPFNRVTQAVNEIRDGFTDEPVSVKDYRERNRSWTPSTSFCPG